MIGSFMAVWIILYGAVQAFAPRCCGRVPARGGADRRGARLGLGAGRGARRCWPLRSLLSGGPAPG
jgi:hypothetical protein